MTAVTQTSKAGRDDEATLVAKVRSGDATCFETLMKRYERKIHRLAKHITKNDSDADEVTQEASFKAFEHIEDFKGESRFYTWLVRITVNQGLMNLRKRRPNQFSLNDPKETEGASIPREIEDWRPTPEARYSQVELAEILSRTIGELQPSLSLVFRLRDVGNLSTDETASLLRISVPAVKSLLLRARWAPREKLNLFLRNSVQSPTTLLCSVSETRDLRPEASQRAGTL